jgi:hypothetical protein
MTDQTDEATQARHSYERSLRLQQLALIQKELDTPEVETAKPEEQARPRVINKPKRVRRSK